jgi:glycerate dehydrogenase
MNLQTGVFLDVGSVDRSDLDLSALTAALPDWQYYQKTPAEQVAERIKAAHIVVSNKVYLGKESLDQSPQLALICVAATGTNNVDLVTARQRNITVSNARNYATGSVVQHVFTLILNLSTRFLSYHDVVSAGQWQNSEQFCILDFPIQELAGKTMGIIGYGVLGHAVAQVAQAFNMKVLIADHKDASPRPDRSAFTDVIRQADVITLHCPLNNATRNLIGSDELSAMKPNAILINAARGGIVDEAALLEALQKGRIAGAGIDVLTEEPPVNGNILLDSALPNLIVTPHIAWASHESRQRLINEVTANILAFKGGKPRNTVVENSVP